MTLGLFATREINAALLASNPHQNHKEYEIDDWVVAVSRSCAAFPILSSTKTWNEIPSQCWGSCTVVVAGLPKSLRGGEQGPLNYYSRSRSYV